VPGTSDAGAASTPLPGTPGSQPGQPGAGPAPGTPGNPLKLDDAQMMRALAHPARIAIMQHLGLEGPATATQCAAVTGLSPSACSYHLRALARYGFVEEEPAATGDGRERPWRARIIAMTLEDHPDQPDAVRAAGRVLLDTVEAETAQLRQRYRDRATEYPADWREAAGGLMDVLHVTASELTQIRDQILELTGRYRRMDPADRPAGTQRVAVVLDLVPWFGPEAVR
jgi:DNA-binding transcriptional ArsR family regulator